MRALESQHPPTVSFVSKSVEKTKLINNNVRYRDDFSMPCVAAVGNNADIMEMRYEDENIWLTQKMMAVLYDVSVPAINQHLKTIFSDGELDEDSVIKKCLITTADGKQYNTKHYNTKHYNLQTIIAVGFKVNNDRAVRFRKWSGQIVRDYTIQGWTMDKERLKKGHMFTDEYFERQL